MNQVTLILIKFLACIIAFAVGLDLFFTANITDILSFSALITIVSYVVGDRIILPRLGNTNASIIDFLLTYMSVWIFGNIVLNNYMQIAWGSFISASLITAAEVVVHRVILKNTEQYQEYSPSTSLYNQGLQYGTEFGEDKDTDIKEDKDED